MNLNENVFRQDLQKQKWIINIQLTQTHVFSLNIIYTFKIVDGRKIYSGFL